MRIFLKTDRRLLFIMITTYHPDKEASLFIIFLQSKKGVAEPLMRHNTVTETTIQHLLISTQSHSAGVQATSDLLKLSLPAGISIAQADEHGYGIRPVTCLGNTTSIYSLRLVFALLDEGSNPCAD